jgi:hypothetical protein
MLSDSHTSGSNPSSTNSHPSDSIAPNHHARGSSSPPLGPQRPEPPILLLLIYTRRPISTSPNQYVPPVLRRLERLAVYENHIRMMTSQLRNSHPMVPFAQIDVDLGFSYAALDHRLQSCFGHTVEEIRFNGRAPEECTWDGSQGPIREVIRVFKVLVH